MTPFQSLLQARPTDPYVQWVLRDAVPDLLLQDGSNIAWIPDDGPRNEVWATALGEDPKACAALIVRLAAEHPFDGVTVPEDAFAYLPEALQSPDHGHWSFWVLDPADAPTLSGDAIVLALDDPRIAPLLAHSTSAYTFPGDPKLVRWAGVVDGERLVSVAGQVMELTGAAHIVSVCTAPDVRGRGLARHACARIIHAAIADGAPMIVLDDVRLERRGASHLLGARVHRGRPLPLRAPPPPASALEWSSGPDRRVTA